MNFPNESADYREARNRLLEAEAELREQAERVAAQRRALPPGGPLKEDYRFEALVDGHYVERPLSSLFGSHNTLMLYSYMFSSDMPRPCPMCSSFLDGLDACAPHISERVALAVVVKSTLPRLVEFARDRGWRFLTLLSSSGTTYNQDYHGEGLHAGKPSQLPTMNVFRRQDGEIRHFWASELNRHPRPGGDPRHLDLAWPLWGALDWAPEGRGEAYPRLDR